MATQLKPRGACAQELCPNWGGDVDACPSESIDLERPCLHLAFIEDETGLRLCVRCDHEWWVDPL